MSKKSTSSIASIPTTIPAFIWHFVRQNKWWFLLVLVIVLLHRGTYIFWPYSSKLIIDSFQKYIDAGSPPGQLLAYVGWIMGLYLIMWWFGAVLYRLQTWIMAYLMPQTIFNIWTGVFEHIQRQSYDFFINHFAGNMSNKSGDLGYGTAMVLRSLITKMFGLLVLFIGTFFVFTTVHWSIVAICLLWMTFHLGYCYIRTPRWNKLSEVSSQARSTLMGRIIDSLSNYINVKIFAGETRERSFLSPFFSNARETDTRKQVTITKDYLFMNIMCPILLHLPMFGAIVYLYSNKTLAVSDIIFILMATEMVSDRTYELGDELTDFTEHYGQIQQAMWLVTTPVAVLDKPGAKSLNIKRAGIDFNNVDFKYDSRRERLFSGFSLHIKPGEKVGVVGYSGAGKSSIIHLLLRYFDIQGGSIQIGQQTISDVTQSSLRESIAFIPQDTALFHRSIFDNIQYGRTGATKKDVISAAKKAYVHDLIMSMPNGYESLVGDRGVKLSVGQRQRIAIARAILKNAPILILDEATSALDSETEVNIQKSLEKLMRGRTTIAIAHRLSTLRNMDRIIVLDQGKIVEEGSHKKLLAQKGLYAHLWSMQSDGFIVTSDNNNNRMGTSIF